MSTKDRIIYCVLGVATVVVLGYLWLQFNEATNGATAVESNLYIVEQQHQNGELLQVHSADTRRILHLRCVDLKCYPYEVGEHINLQVECAGSIARLFKLWDDGTGEYFYHTESYQEDKELCP